MTVVTQVMRQTVTVVSPGMAEDGFGCLSGRGFGPIEDLEDLRNANLTFEVGSRRLTCAACGSDQHVRPWNEADELGFCRDCHQQAQMPETEAELGGEA